MREYYLQEGSNIIKLEPRGNEIFISIEKGGTYYTESKLRQELVNLLDYLNKLEAWRKQ